MPFWTTVANRLMPCVTVDRLSSPVWVTAAFEPAPVWVTVESWSLPSWLTVAESPAPDCVIVESFEA